MFSDIFRLVKRAPRSPPSGAPQMLKITTVIFISVATRWHLASGSYGNADLQGTRAPDQLHGRVLQLEGELHIKMVANRDPAPASGPTHAADSGEAELPQAQGTRYVTRQLAETLDSAAMRPIILDRLAMSNRRKDWYPLRCLAADHCPDFSTCPPPPNASSWELVPKGALSACRSPWLPEEAPALHFALAPLNCPKKTDNPIGAEGRDESCSHFADFGWRFSMDFQVYRLERVYVNAQTQVFNATAIFLRGGCQDGPSGGPPFRLEPGPSRQVVHADVAASWAYNQAVNFYHGLIEAFPTFLTLAPLLHANPQLPLVATSGQWGVYEASLGPILGIPAGSLRKISLEPDGPPLHAFRTLYQPIFQYCGHTSSTIWGYLRSRHFLHPDGIPLFAPGWARRETTPLSEQAMARVPEDWLVVVARRSGPSRQYEGMDAVLSAVQSMFPRHRVAVFDGPPTGILEARALFRRARVLIAEHGGAMSNMVFMPVNSSVVEIRPRRYANSCYHHLAEVCRLRYHLLLGEGDFDSQIVLEPRTVISLIEQVIVKMYL